jgi:hypothetical protein
MKNFLFAILFSLSLTACVSPPKLSPELIRAGEDTPEGEYPGEKPVIAQYKKGPYRLSYLAARHSTMVGSDTMNLVEVLFQQKNFKVLLIESIPYAVGESPKWFVEESKKGATEKFYPGGESALGAILADQEKIPFYAGEPTHSDVWNELKKSGYSELDIYGYYLARQIPQWIRQNEDRNNLIERMGPSFISNYCLIFRSAACPTLTELQAWYKEQSGHDLSIDISNEEFSPYKNGTLLTQRMSADLGHLRDHFTLNIIENLLNRYKEVAVIYGAGHFLNLRKSFEAAMGQPTFIEDKEVVAGSN